MTEKLFEVEIGPDKELVFRFHRPRSLVPDMARDRMRSSAKGMLEAFRDLVDAALEVVEEKEGTKKESQKIEVK
ncbi:MAG: hypothetical protein HY671_10895 [Chloroflexi bacterium]|nr:hypothetical protein [Chloroflexota bacterium]